MRAGPHPLTAFAAMALLRIRDQVLLLDEWQTALETIEAADSDFRDLLESKGLDRPWVVANLVELDPDLDPPTPGRHETPEELRDRVDAAVRDGWTDVLTRMNLLQGALH